MTGLLSLIIVFNKFKLKLIKVKFSDIKIMLIEGWHIFVTTILSSILTNTGPFILGIYIDKQTVGYYGAIDKIVKALSSLFSPLTQAIFPYVSSKFKLSFEEGKKEVYKFAKVVMPICLIITANLMLFSKYIVKILYGDSYVNYHKILMYLSIWILNGVLNNFIGIQYMVASGNGKLYSKAFTISAIVTLVCFISLIKHISYYSIIFGTILGELTLTIFMLFYNKKYIRQR